MTTVHLGDTVRDKITGFQGVAISTHRYLTGCIRVAVQPKAAGDGSWREAIYFDESALEVTRSDWQATDAEKRQSNAG